MQAQNQFDKMVKEFSKDSSSLEEAIIEAIDIVKETMIDLNTTFLYETQLELIEKEKYESRCKTIENASNHIDTFVNANFALQGCKQLLTGLTTDKVTIGLWKLTEARRLFQTVIRLIPAVDKDSSDVESEGDAADDDSDDEGQNKIISTVRPLEFLCTLLQHGPSVSGRIYNMTTMYEVSEEDLAFLCKRLDEDMTESRYNIQNNILIVFYTNLYTLSIL